MKKLWIISIAILLWPLLLPAQTETVVPRAGEGRHARSTNTALWVNPLFMQPGVFPTQERVDLRQPRKWWRAEHSEVRPVKMSAPERMTEQNALPVLYKPGSFNFSNPTRSTLKERSEPEAHGPRKPVPAVNMLFQ